MNEKPHFYIMDLDNYNEDFLKEIILWQKDRLEKLEKELKAWNDNNKY